MNRQEAIKILDKERKEYIAKGCKLDKAIDMAIDALQDDWIPVSERLPEEYDQYLCYCEDGYYYVYWLENKPWAETIVKKEEIIAWQPLHAPYKESEK